MLKEFAEQNLLEVNPPPSLKGRNKSFAGGYCRLLDRASQNQDPYNSFKPFGILEDDAAKYRDFPLSLKIPEDTDILYIGLSKCGMNSTRWCNDLRYIHFNSDIIKVYNMLATHGMIVCSTRGLLSLQKCMLEALFSDTIGDKLLAHMQPYINAYALKHPLVYQCKEMGGGEQQTKYRHSNPEDKPLPPDWINLTNISIKTNYDD